MRQALALLVVALALGGCGDPLGACNGSLGLTGTGFFEPINGMRSPMATAQSWSCNEMQLAAIELCESGCYIANDYVSLSLYLPPPLFVGRTYGVGTKLSVHPRGHPGLEIGHVSGGGITVVGVRAKEDPEACANELTLAFDLTIQNTGGALHALSALTEDHGSLRGTATFSYGGTGQDIWVDESDRVVRQDCLPPQFESGAENQGGHVVDGSQGYDHLPLGDVVHWGTEVNRIEVDDVRAEFVIGEQEGSEHDILIRVTPPSPPTGNWLCDIADAANSPLACPRASAVEGFQFERLPATFVDRFGLRPTITGSTDEWGHGETPAVTAPTHGEILYAGEPLVVEWDPDGSASAALTLEVRFDALADEPAYELAVEDAGSVTLDVPWPEDYAGTATLVLRRTWDPGDPFPWPVAEGSYVHVVRERRVQVQIERGGQLEFPPAGELPQGWTAPVAIGTSWGGAADEPVAELRLSPGGRLLAAWTAASRVVVAEWLPATARWSENLAPSAPAVERGPLVLSARDDGFLVAGYDWDDGPRTYAPIVRAVGADGVGVGGYVENAAPHDRPYGFAAALLEDGARFVAYASPERQLFTAVDDEPLAPVEPYDYVGWASLSAFDRADGGVTLYFSDHMNVRAWVSGPGTALAGLGGGMDFWFQRRGCGTWGAPEPERRHAHFVCVADDSEDEDGLYYRRFPLRADDPEAADVTEKVALDFAPFLEENLVYLRTAVAPGGAVWFLAVVTCDDGHCPVLARRTRDGVWEGPWLPSHAMGWTSLGVDADDRVHLLWADGEGQLMHSHMEVAP